MTRINPGQQFRNFMLDDPQRLGSQNARERRTLTGDRTRTTPQGGGEQDQASAAQRVMQQGPAIGENNNLPDRSQRFQYDPQSVNEQGNLAGGAMEAFNQVRQQGPATAEQAQQQGQQAGQQEADQARQGMQDRSLMTPAELPGTDENRRMIIEGAIDRQRRAEEQAQNERMRSPTESLPDNPTAEQTREAANEALQLGDEQGYRTLNRAADSLSRAEQMAIQNQQDQAMMGEVARTGEGEPARMRNLTPDQQQQVRGDPTQVGESTTSRVPVDYSGTLDDPAARATAAGDFTGAQEIREGSAGPGVGGPAPEERVEAAQANLEQRTEEAGSPEEIIANRAARHGMDIRLENGQLVAGEGENAQPLSTDQAQRMIQERVALGAQTRRAQARQTDIATGGTGIASTDRVSGRPAAGETPEQYQDRLEAGRRTRMGPEMQQRMNQQQAVDLAQDQQQADRQQELMVTALENLPEDERANVGELSQAARQRLDTVQDELENVYLDERGNPVTGDRVTPEMDREASNLRMERDALIGRPIEVNSLEDAPPQGMWVPNVTRIQIPEQGLFMWDGSEWVPQNQQQ